MRIYRVVCAVLELDFILFERDFMFLNELTNGE